MSESEYYFQADLAPKIEAAMKKHEVTELIFAWNGEAIQSMSSKPELPLQGALYQEITQFIKDEIKDYYPEFRGVRFTFYSHPDTVRLEWPE